MTKKLAPPSPRGRRGHKSIDDQPGLKEWLMERFLSQPQPTLDEVLAELKTTDFRVGRTAVWQFRSALLKDDSAGVQRACLAALLTISRNLSRLVEELTAAGVIGQKTSDRRPSSSETS